ncbi:MAG: hypothetical protein IPG00_02920, partial [Saprospiraceae bacterium]|nr:hypothetical protein [Saprospiraceae bacterium]
MESVFRELGLSRQALHQQCRRDMGQQTHHKHLFEIVKEWRMKHPRMGVVRCNTVHKNIGGIDLGMGVNKFEQLMSTSGMTIKPLRSRIV